jgi:hypothetical protein
VKNGFSADYHQQYLVKNPGASEEGREQLFPGRQIRRVFTVSEGNYQSAVRTYTARPNSKYRALRALLLSFSPVSTRGSFLAIAWEPTSRGRRLAPQIL